MIKDFVFELLKFIGELNYWHICLFSALESTIFPVIIPVETLIIPMGYYAYLGTKSLPLLMFSCTFGIVIGCLINYFFARLLGRNFIYKHAKLLHINVEKLQKMERKFLTHGRLIIFVGRFVPIPAFKHIVTIPAGMAKMPVFQFVLYNALGGFIFSTSMLMIGYFFGGSEKLVSKALTNFTIICVCALCLYILIKIIIKFIKHKQKQDNKGIIEDFIFNPDDQFSASPSHIDILKLKNHFYENKNKIKHRFLKRKHFNKRKNFFKKRRQKKFFRKKDF